MAKRKKRVTHRRRRRVSGPGTATVMSAAAIAAGTVAGQFISGELSKRNIDPKIAAGIQLVAGVLVASKGRGIAASVGTGIAVSGIVSLARGFGVISGVGAPMVTFRPQQSVIQGYNVPTGIGMPELNVISGLGLS